MNRIDFDLIVNELRKGLRPHTDPIAQAILARTQFFHEFRTIGLTAARQTGKSRWAFEQLAKDRSACMIVPKGLTRDEIFQYEDRMGVVNVDERTFTIREVQHLICRDKFEAWSTIYFDDATHKYHFLKKQLLEYLHKHQRFETTIILVG
jgi:hypothetical protein